MGRKFLDQADSHNLWEKSYKNTNPLNQRLESNMLIAAGPPKSQSCWEREEKALHDGQSLHGQTGKV